MVSNTDLFGDLPSVDISFADTGDEARGDVGVDDTGNGDQRDNREGDEADLPDTDKPNGESRNETADVVNEVASLQCGQVCQS